MLTTSSLSPRWRVSRLEAEASAMEDEFGTSGALEVVRDMIVRADRTRRRRLYRLHDEIARRRLARGSEEVDLPIESAWLS